MLALTLALALAAGPRIAVMPVQPGDVLSDRAAAAFTDQLAAELRRQSGLEVLTPRDVAGAFAADRQKVPQPGCATDPGLAEVAAAIGADRMVTSDVGRLGDSLLLHVRLLDTHSVRALAIADRRVRTGTPEDLLDQLPAIVREVLRVEAPAPWGDKVVLHYHRADGRYEASLYSWESYETGAELRRTVPVVFDIRVPTVEPDGHDDFGVLWILPAGRFRNGRVNFQIQQAGSWDECIKYSLKPPNPLHYSGLEPSLGAAPYWLLSEGRELWVNAPECELHPSLERALRTQRKKGK